MTFELPDIIINPKLEKVFLSLGDSVTILQPKSLARKINKIFKHGLDNYKNPEEP